MWMTAFTLPAVSDDSPGLLSCRDASRATVSHARCRPPATTAEVGPGGRAWNCRILRVAVCTVLLLCAMSPVAFAQLKPAETVQSFNVPEGFEISLFASEPMISNPIAVDVDTYGRVWVTEGVDYRRAKKNPPVDKIKVLEDTDGDGRADKVTVFTSDLNAAMGICVAGSKIYVPESPNLYVYEDKDGDLKPDGPRQTLLTGFGGFNHDHGVHSQVFGPDHKLYMTNGDTGFDVTGPDGSHIQFQWGGMIRCEADGSQLDAFAVNFRNPVELAVDSFGHVWCSDNDNDGLKSVRICWILEGGNYGWFGRPENIRNPDGSFDPIHHWRADKPGFVPYVLITGFGSPCGMTFQEGSAFGPQYRGTLFHCDAGPQEIRSYSPKKLSGVGFGAGIENIVTSPDRYFRPIDICTAPDGSMFATDWYDGGVGGHAYNDPSRGRIYCITPTDKSQLGRKEKAGPYDNDADALQALASPNLATQFLARERLLESGEKAIPALTQLAGDEDAIIKARALWLLDRIGGDGRDVVRQQLQSDDPAFRALAVRILRRRLPETEMQLLALADDPSSEVLGELLVAIPHMQSERATKTLVKLFDRYDGSDRFLLEALHIAAKGREKHVFEEVVEKNSDTIDSRLVSLVRALRPQDATEYLSGKLSTAGLPAEVQQSLLEALTSAADPKAGRSTASLLNGDASPELKRLALDSLRRNLNGSWSSLKDDAGVRSGLSAALANPELAAAALAVIGDTGLDGYSSDVVRLVTLESGSRETRLAAVTVAGRLGVTEAAPALAKLLKSEDRVLREAALNSLVAIRDIATLGKILTGTDFGAEVQQETVDRLVLSSDGAIYLLRLVETNRLNQSLNARVIEAAINHPDVNVRLLFEQFVPESERPKTLGQSFSAEDILKLEGNVARGKSVFLRSGAASCIKCHRVKGDGNDIGPDLSQIGRKYERGALLKAILEPSAGIAPEFVPYVIETQEGKVHAGFIQQQNDAEVVLRTIEGAPLRIARSDIEEIVKKEISLMPELLLKNVTAQDAADLLAYLSSLQAVEVYATDFIALGPFPNDKAADRATDFGPESQSESIDIKARYAGLNGQQVRWIPAKTRSYAGSPPSIDLTRLTERAKARSNNVVYYFAATVNSSTAQPATFNVGSDDGIQVWLNGEKIHDHKVTRALQAGQDKIDVQLRQGANTVLLKLDQGNGAAGLAFSVEARSNVTFGTP